MSRATEAGIVSFPWSGPDAEVLVVARVKNMGGLPSITLSAGPRARACCSGAQSSRDCRIAFWTFFRKGDRVKLSVQRIARRSRPSSKRSQQSRNGRFAPFVVSPSLMSADVDFSSIASTAQARHSGSDFAEHAFSRRNNRPARKRIEVAVPRGSSSTNLLVGFLGTEGDGSDRTS